MKARRWRMQGCRGAILTMCGNAALLAAGFAAGIPASVAQSAAQQSGSGSIVASGGVGSGALVASGVVGGGLNTAGSHAADAASQAAISGSSTSSLGLEAMAQAIFGLLLVVGLILGCAWLARRFGVNRSAPRPGLVKFVSSTALSQKERVMVVQIEDTWLVLGVAPGSVNHLHTLPARDTAPASSASVAPNVSQFAMDFRQRLSEKLGKSRRDDSGGV
jgi:flagellar protein FliO/FliZ